MSKVYIADAKDIPDSDSSHLHDPATADKTSKQRRTFTTLSIRQEMVLGLKDVSKEEFEIAFKNSMVNVGMVLVYTVIGLIGMIVPCLLYNGIHEVKTEVELAHESANFANTGLLLQGFGIFALTFCGVNADMVLKKGDKVLTSKRLGGLLLLRCTWMVPVGYVVSKLILDHLEASLINDHNMHIWVQKFLLKFVFAGIALVYLHILYYETKESDEKRQERNVKKVAEKSKLKFMLIMILPVIVCFVLVDATVVVAGTLIPKIAKRISIGANELYLIIFAGACCRIGIVYVFRFFMTNMLGWSYSTKQYKTLYFVVSYIAMQIDTQVRVASTLVSHTSAEFGAACFSALAFGLAEFIQRFLSIIMLSRNLRKVDKMAKVPGHNQQVIDQQKAILIDIFSITTNANLLAEYLTIAISIIVVLCFQNAPNFIYGEALVEDHSDHSGAEHLMIVGLIQFVVELAADSISSVFIETHLKISLRKKWNRVSSRFLVLEIIWVATCCTFNVLSASMTIKEGGHHGDSSEGGHHGDSSEGVHHGDSSDVVLDHSDDHLQQISAPWTKEL